MISAEGPVDWAFARQKLSWWSCPALIDPQKVPPANDSERRTQSTRCQQSWKEGGGIKSNDDVDITN